MEKLMEKLSRAVAAAFEAAGYDPACGKVTVSNRPDLCEFQCNGAMPAAKTEHKAPLLIAQDVAEKLQDSPVFSVAEAVKPGFLNLRVRPEYLAAHIEEMRAQQHLGVTGSIPARTVVLDYGGPNVAKPLHVGHLRPAIIGESIKRIYRYFGDKVIGDIHLGDWGLQMGLVIAELQERHPELPYFDENATEYPDGAPCTVSELEEIIDVIEWNPDPSTFLASALLPAQIMAVDIKEEEKFAQVIVQDDQLSLAIGKSGQNVRLAAKLTGWKIDIKTETQFRELLAQKTEEPEKEESESKEVQENVEE